MRVSKLYQKTAAFALYILFTGARQLPEMLQSMMQGSPVQTPGHMPFFWYRELHRGWGGNAIYDYDQATWRTGTAVRYRGIFQ